MPDRRQRPESDALVWSVAEYRAAIECSWSILEEIHGAVQEGFRRLSRGGLEVGGVLFGRRKDQVIQILAWRPIPCQHTRGPAFLLTPEEKQSLLDLLAQAEEDPQLQVLEPVGWFVSHTRQGVVLTDEDQHLFRQFFPEPWHVTLVLHPNRREPTRAGFFVREKDGRIRTESSYQEFLIAGARAPEVGRNGYGVPPPEKSKRNSSPGAPLLVEVQPNNRSIKWRWAMVGFGALVFAVLLLAMPKRRSEGPVTGEALHLRLLDAAGQLRVEWDRNSSTIRQAEGATLHITDGRPLSPIELDRDTAQKGFVTYGRLTEDVRVRLVVRRTGQPPYEEMSRYVGAPVPKEEPAELKEARARRDQTVEETRKLREQLSKEMRKAEELENAVTHLERQVERESKKRN